MTLNHSGFDPERVLLVLRVQTLAASIAESEGVAWDEEAIGDWAVEVLDAITEEAPSGFPDDDSPSVSSNYGLITVGGVGEIFSEARSRRLRNVRFNLSKLFKGAIALSLAVPAALNMPWATPFLVLRSLLDLNEAMEVKLTERDAAVIWTMWRASDPGNMVRGDTLLEQVNGQLEAYGRSKVSQTLLDESLIRLQEVAVIKPAAGGKWALIDKLEDSRRR